MVVACLPAGHGHRSRSRRWSLWWVSLWSWELSGPSAGLTRVPGGTFSRWACSQPSAYRGPFPNWGIPGVSQLRVPLLRQALPNPDLDRHPHTYTHMYCATHANFQVGCIRTHTRTSILGARPQGLFRNAHVFAHTRKLPYRGGRPWCSPNCLMYSRTRTNFHIGSVLPSAILANLSIRAHAQTSGCRTIFYDRVRAKEKRATGTMKPMTLLGV